MTRYDGNCRPEVAGHRFESGAENFAHLTHSAGEM
jgi:hypothetical protein